VSGVGGALFSSCIYSGTCPGSLGTAIGGQHGMDPGICGSAPADACALLCRILGKRVEDWGNFAVKSKGVVVKAVI